jgi:hypothetical protein
MALALAGPYRTEVLSNTVELLAETRLCEGDRS